MPRPVMLAVDDDADVLRAVERDLRKQYSDRYRVMSADSGPGALNTLERLAQRGEPVALLIADYRMPHMTGIEFLAAAIRQLPDVRRVLLTAYADTEAAIGAINVVKLDHYLLKPWDPPDRNLYPVLDDLLDQWSASYRPPFEGIRVIGTRWSRRCYEMREFLARNQIPYQWLDVESAGRDADVAKAVASVPEGVSRLPVVLLADGTALVGPAQSELADRIGLRTRSDTSFFDLVIVGGGPAGLAARRLRRFRGAEDRDRGTRGAGRAGRPEFANRELSRVSIRPERKRPGTPRRRAGQALRRRDPGPAGSGEGPRAKVRTASSRWPMAASCPVTPWSSPRACSGASSMCPASSVCRAPASTMGRVPPRRSPAAMRMCTSWAAPTRPARQP